MPRVYMQKAAKDYPAEGITKGQTYYSWSVRTGPVGGRTYRSATYPRPSQLNFGFRGRLGDIELDMGNAQDPEELRNFAEALRELGQECQESFDNMPEGLQQGDTGQLLEERAQGLEGWADEVEEAADTWENELSALGELAEAWATYDTEYAEYEQALSEFEDADKEAQADMEEPVEPVEPDEERPGDEAEEELLRSQYTEQATSANPGL